MESSTKARLSEQVWKPRYATGRDDLFNAFYLRALASASRYDRATGYFRSSFFQIAGPALAQFALRGGVARLVCSPDLRTADVEAIAMGQATKRAVASAALLREYKAVLTHPDAASSADLLSALLATGALEIRLAVPNEGSGIFHDKIGLFVDEYADRVTFVGSVNETWSAWHPLGNHESFEVFTSWGEEASRTIDHEVLFAELWASRLEGLTTVEPTDDVLQVLRERAGNDPVETLRRAAIRPAKPNEDGARPLLPHQVQAIEAWKAAGRRGIFKHATGSGKTVTALAAIRDHVATGHPAIVLVPSSLLLMQWDREIHRELLDIDPSVLLGGGGAGDWRRLARAFTEPDGDVPRIIVATMATACKPAFLERVVGGEHLLVVADEVHRLGAPKLGSAFGITAGATLGLSATPERAGDPDGTARVFDYFGGIVPPVITLADALAVGRLCPYEYFASLVPLSSDEAEEWLELTRQIKRVAAQLHSSGSDPVASMDSRLQMLLLQRARIHRGASAKPRMAAEIVAASYQRGQSWLVYCDTISQLHETARELEHRGIASMPYYSGMPGHAEATLDRFSRDGGVIVSVRCLDEGVDIPSVSHAVIAASSRNPREFIQRRGRVLRTAKAKTYATIHDLIVPPPAGEVDDFMPLALGELARAYEFAGSAMNESGGLQLQRFAIDWGLDPGVVATTGYEDDEGDDES